MARRLVFKGSLNGTSPIYRYFPVNDNQTIYAGDIVILSNGKASIGADAATAVLGVSNTDIVTTTAAATDIIAVDINPASIYEISYTGTGTPAIGTKYDMGTAAYEFDVADTSGGYIQVVGNVDTTAKTADVILCSRVFGMA